MLGLRTWIEIDKNALEHNLREFLNLIPKKTRFMAVIKSNAYGHGLALAAKLLANLQLQTPNPQPRLWFGVDSIVEALRLRRDGIQNQILVLGPTLPSRLKEAYDNNITLTVSNFESLISLIRTNKRIVFHLKIDTGMHRQGFLQIEIAKLLNTLKTHKLSPSGAYTHFASAKDIAYPTYTIRQLQNFNDIISKFKNAGFQNLIRHSAASGGTLLFPQSHMDMVRIGMGLYGYWPSLESRIQNLESRILLKPVLTWKTVISEIKKIPKGSYVGYDLTEKVHRDTKIAILPVGYWHGYDRGLSGIGEVLIRGKRARVLGRVSMDMITVDINNIPKIKIGDEVVLIGQQNKNAIWADEIALKIGTSQYEVLTRINPLIKRIVK